MTFSEALDFMKLGGHVARESAIPNVLPTPWVAIKGTRLMYQADNGYVPFTPTAADMLSDDWVSYEAHTIHVCSHGHRSVTIDEAIAS